MAIMMHMVAVRVIQDPICQILSCHRTMGMICLSRCKNYNRILNLLCDLLSYRDARSSVLGGLPNSPYTNQTPLIQATPVNQQGSGPQQGAVLMVYGLNHQMMNCDRLFNLFCQYGNVVRV